MKEYYCLLLNNSYDIEPHWVSIEPFSMAPNVLVKELEDLSQLEEEFMGLDNTIRTDENSYHVLGNFPIFGTIGEDGNMYEIITGYKIMPAKNYKEASDLSYKAKYKANGPMVEEMLTLLDEESKTRYIDYLDRLMTYSKTTFHNGIVPKGYYIYRPNNSNLNAPVSIGKRINNQLIDCVTKEKVIIIPKGDYKTSRLSTDINMYTQISEKNAKKYLVDLIDNGIENYIANIKETKTNSIRGYHTFIDLNKDKPKAKRKTK